MIRDLQGRVALVTGSATGIGRAVAEALAARGCAVVAHGLDAAGVHTVLSDWQARGWRAAGSTVDLGNVDGARRLHDGCVADLGALDILVLNASIEVPEEIGKLTPAAMERQYRVNLAASCMLLQHCLPAMEARNWGRIVGIGTVQEERPNARHIFYAATKSALTSIILNIARQGLASGITANVVRPGAIATDRNRAALADTDYREAVLARIPIGRVGIPQDCTELVSLLCSDNGGYINGAVVAVDGGLRL